jgi:hypothetical protein
LSLGLPLAPSFSSFCPSSRLDVRSLTRISSSHFCRLLAHTVCVRARFQKCHTTVADLFLSTIFGGGAVAYASLRTDDIGTYGMKVGEYTLKAVDKGKELDSEYKLTEQVKSKVDGLFK